MRQAPAIGAKNLRSLTMAAAFPRTESRSTWAVQGKPFTGEPIQFYVTKCDKIGRRRVCKSLNDLVELVGLEPTASSLRTTRSPN